ncbi:MAG TPA: hypothetical protein DCG19_01965 [Cryomorphaceae bacterium]|nr:hypothetical protein [Owenweeksia sp.]MBF98538.1 hypothetical protein [Owenweeksia sp.]HAD96137.1 hypothetical protein [Cryomorphaceae bacterium]HBF18774.1 hypothetical protein [Cryomorphaceae bacterium]HCQ14945.1 hypothetical protein [Cryomorphaceae bacterium]|tara:strand:- start:13280 stop:13465 length:186 start_codon:yes stop_codon:yes gene_type:complete
MVPGPVVNFLFPGRQGKGEGSEKQLKCKTGSQPGGYEFQEAGCISDKSRNGITESLTVTWF